MILTFCHLQEEEQDVHTRAELYAMTAQPDSSFFLLPQDNCCQVTSPNSGHDSGIDSSFMPPKKKRRRNYGNGNCFVSHHNHEDVFDNTKMLPIGKKFQFHTMRNQGFQCSLWPNTHEFRAGAGQFL